MFETKLFIILLIQNIVFTDQNTSEDDLGFLQQILKAENLQESLREFKLNDYFKHDFSEQSNLYKITLAEVQAMKLIQLQSQTPNLALERQRWFTYKNSVLSKLNFQTQNLNVGVKIFNKVLKLYKGFYKNCEIFFDNLDYQTTRDMYYYFNSQYSQIFQNLNLEEIFPISKNMLSENMPNFAQMKENNKKIDEKMGKFLNQIQSSSFGKIHKRLVELCHIIYKDLKSMDGGVTDMLKFYDLYEIFLSMQLKSEWDSRKQIILRNLTDLNTKWRTNFLIPFLDSLPNILYASKNIEILYQLPDSELLTNKEFQVIAIYLIILYSNFDLLQIKIFKLKGTESYLKQYYQQTVEVLRDLDLGIANNNAEEKILNDLAKSFQLNILPQKYLKKSKIYVFFNKQNFNQQMNLNINRGGYIMSLLKNNSKEAKNYALEQMDKNMHYRWFFYIDNIQLLEMEYEMGNIDTKYAASIISKVYFYADQIEKAVLWAQKSGDYFKIQNRSLYADTLITTIVDTYTQILSGKLNIDDETQKKFYEKVVLEILDCSFAMNIDFDKKLLIGLAIETDKLNFISQYIDTLNDKQLNEFFNFLTSQIHVHRNKKQIYEIFLKSLQNRKDKYYNLISQCLVALEMPEEHSNMIAELYQQDKAMALQIATNIEETGNFYYINKILNNISKNNEGQNFTELVQVLSGEFREKINNKFMSQNNNVDLQLLKNLIPRWDPSNSIVANGYSMYFALALQGTKDLNPLVGEDNKKKFEKISDWALFSTTASLGLIFPKTSEFDTKVKKLFLKEGEFTQGGKLYAEGLSMFGVGLSEEQQHTMMENVQDENKSEGLRHGSAMLLGLSNFQTNNVTVAEKLLVNIYGEKANIGEASGYALGLVKATHWDEDVVNNLINSSRNNQHDRIARSMMAALGLMALGNQEKVMNCFQELIKEKFAILRMGAVNALSMAYFNTNNNKVISELLQIAATDLSNDVRRVAVLGIGYVMIQNQQKILTLMSMLCKSYNDYVRHGVALVLGIVGAHRFNKQYHTLLMTLFEDKCFHVRQAAGIALGLLHQLSTEHIDPQFKETIEKLTQKFEQKTESSGAKMGYLWGFGLLQSGGGNSVFSVISNEGNLKLKNIVGLYLFTFYWYWYPLANMIGLTLEPTYLVGVTEDLKVPRGFQFISKAPKKYFDYYKTQVKEEKKEKFAPVVLSTTKKVEARRQQNVSIIEQKAQQKKQEEEQKEQMEKQKKEEEEKKQKEQEDEAKFVVLDNPARVLQKQEQFIDFNVDNKRYEVVLKDRTNGMVFLRDTQKDLPEIYIEQLPEQKHLIPPKNFIFRDDEENK